MQNMPSTIVTSLVYSLAVKRFIDRESKCFNKPTLIDLSGKYVTTNTVFNSHGHSASFSCLRLFPHLLLKIQNSFLSMC